MPLFHKTVFPLLIVLFFVGSCSNNETDFLVDLCVVKERGDHSLYLLSDRGYELTPASSLDASKYIQGDRFKVSYNVMEDKTQNKQTINVKSILRVVIKNAEPRDAVSDQLENPIWLLQMPWVGGGFLNFDFSFAYYNLEIKHGIHLVVDSVAHSSVGNDKIYLTFGHDSKGDTSQKMAIALLSFPLTSIPGVQSADSLIVTVLETRTKIVRIPISN